MHPLPRSETVIRKWKSPSLYLYFVFSSSKEKRKNGWRFDRRGHRTMASARGTLPETSCMFPRRRNMADMYVDRIRQLVETDCKTYQEVSAILQKSTGWTRGFSARTIRRLCAEHGIRTRGKQLVPDAELEAHVTAAIHEVGHQQRWLACWIYK